MQSSDAVMAVQALVVPRAKDARRIERIRRVFFMGLFPRAGGRELKRWSLSLGDHRPADFKLVESDPDVGII
jgi:hypothetical protein